MKSGLIALAAILFAFSRITAAKPDVAAAWFAGWHEDRFTPHNISWDKYTHMKYAFAVTSPDSKLDKTHLIGLKDFVSEAQSHKVKAMVSIGGWTGSRHFSTVVAKPDSRSTFVKAVIDLAHDYHLDGVDFDWEYPNNLGVGCNSINEDDITNFQLFLEELRRDIGNTFIITAAAGLNPWLGKDQQPVKDVSAFAKVLDYVAIMNYDVWGSFSQTVGPNAPLRDGCGPSPGSGSAQSGVQNWKAAGMPSNQIVLGIPSYGHSYRVSKDKAIVNGKLVFYPPFDEDDQPRGDMWDVKPGPDEKDVCGLPIKGYSGVYQYSGMVQLGNITSSGEPKQKQTRAFDQCSQTPFIYDSDNEVMVSYDDPQSMKNKGEFIDKQHLRGFAMWEVGGDYKDTLVTAIRSKIEGMHE